MKKAQSCKSDGHVYNQKKNICQKHIECYQTIEKLTPMSPLAKSTFVDTKLFISIDVRNTHRVMCQLICGGHECQNQEVGLTENNLIIVSRENYNCSCILARPSVSNMQDGFKDKSEDRDTSQQAGAKVQAKQAEL